MKNTMYKKCRNNTMLNEGMTDSYSQHTTKKRQTKMGNKNITKM